jgi:hypothetical protein
MNCAVPRHQALDGADIIQCLLAFNQQPRDLVLFAAEEGSVLHNVSLLSNSRSRLCFCFAPIEFYPVYLACD